MAQIWRHCRAIAAALLGLVALAFAPAFAEDQGAKDATDLYDRPVLAIDPGMHTAAIRSQAVDAEGRFAVTGGDDRTVRIWSVADGKLLRTIWIPVGPENVGRIYAVAISPDGSTIAAGGYTERRDGDRPNLYLRPRVRKPDSANCRRSAGCHALSSRSRRTAATSPPRSAAEGLRVFDRDKNWSEAFRDDQYGDDSYGATFAHDGRLATTSYDGRIRLYKYDPNSDSPNFRAVRSAGQRAERRSPARCRFQSGRQKAGCRLRRRRGGRYS